MNSYNEKEINYILENYTYFSPDLYLRNPPEKELRWEIVLPQMDARKRAAEKLPDWVKIPRLIFPERKAIEQCSSQITAQWKRDFVELLPKERRLVFTDLSGGFGVDSWYMAQAFDRANYVEPRPELHQIARHNFEQLGGTPFQTHLCKAEDFLQKTPPIGGFAFLDPDRRNAQEQRMAALSDCSPNVIELLPQLKRHFHAVLIKLSPMLDLQSILGDLPDCHALHIWATQKECKELIAFLDFSQPAPQEVPLVARHAGDPDFTFTRASERNAICPLAGEPETYLYEPNVALLKAGAFQSIGAHYQLKKLHPNSHLYTSARFCSDFPGRRFHILKVFGFRGKEIRQALMGIQGCEITVRNFPISAPEIRKKLKIKDGNSHTLFATTLRNGEHRLLLCEKM